VHALLCLLPPSLLSVAGSLSKCGCAFDAALASILILSWVTARTWVGKGKIFFIQGVCYLHGVAVIAVEICSSPPSLPSILSLRSCCGRKLHACIISTRKQEVLDWKIMANVSMTLHKLRIFRLCPFTILGFWLWQLSAQGILPWCAKQTAATALFGQWIQTSPQNKDRKNLLEKAFNHNSRDVMYNASVWLHYKIYKTRKMLVIYRNTAGNLCQQKKWETPTRAGRGEQWGPSSAAVHGVEEGGRRREQQGGCEVQVEGGRRERELDATGDKPWNGPWVK
jgi:hypothetical protein